MVVEEFLTFPQWLYHSALPFLGIVFALFVLQVIFGFVVAAFHHGPDEAFFVVARFVHDLTRDVLSLSPRRVWALALLAMREALRRWVLAVIVVFMIVLLFAGWYLDVKSDNPALLYLWFTLNTTVVMISLLAVTLAAFSLPEDIQNRTIFTVVTKPVRTLEIVVGRFLGFALLGTAILLGMGVLSYVFVTRGVNHRHDVTPDALAAARAVDAGQEIGPDDPLPETSRSSHHRHRLRVNPVFDSEGRRVGEQVTLDHAAGHSHVVKTTGEGEQATFAVSAPVGALEARVPVYGKLKHFTADGKEGRGLNVGNEWTYRGYIEGGAPLARAEWTFGGLSRRQFAEGLPLELTIRVERTHKGDITKGVRGDVFLRNPETKAQSVPRVFTSQEFSVQKILIPNRLEVVDADGRAQPADLFETFVTKGGETQLCVRCIERGQYFGMAQADAYFRAADRPFFYNFFKGFLVIWTQMLILIGFALAFGALLNRAVALFASLFLILLGYCKQFVFDVWQSQWLGEDDKTFYGGGPVESLVRLVTQQNIMTNLEPAWASPGVWFVDNVFLFMVRALAAVIPDFNRFNTVEYVMKGYNIPLDALLVNGTLGVVFALGLAVQCNAFLKSREIAS